MERGTAKTWMVLSSTEDNGLFHKIGTPLKTSKKGEFFTPPTSGGGLPLSLVMA